MTSDSGARSELDGPQGPHATQWRTRRCGAARASLPAGAARPPPAARLPADSQAACRAVGRRVGPRASLQGRLEDGPLGHRRIRRALAPALDHSDHPRPARARPLPSAPTPLGPRCMPGAPRRLPVDTPCPEAWRITHALRHGEQGRAVGWGGEMGGRRAWTAVSSPPPRSASSRPRASRHARAHVDDALPVALHHLSAVVDAGAGRTARPVPADQRPQKRRRRGARPIPCGITCRPGSPPSSLLAGRRAPLSANRGPCGRQSRRTPRLRPRARSAPPPPALAPDPKAGRAESLAVPSSPSSAPSGPPPPPDGVHFAARQSAAGACAPNRGGPRPGRAVARAKGAQGARLAPGRSFYSE